MSAWFAEALRRAQGARTRAMIEAMKAAVGEEETARLADRAFYTSLQTSGFKLICSEPTEAMVGMWDRNCTTRTNFRRMWDTAPTITELLPGGAPQGGEVT